MEKHYDLVIIGGGPAGLTAGIYANQLGLKSVVVEKEVWGGQIATTYEVLNYTGYDKISGEELSLKMYNHAKSLGVELVNDEIKGTNLECELKEIYGFKNTYKAKAVIIAIGTKTRNLGVENEKDYIGKGLSFSATKDREKFVGCDVAIVGGGNTAIEDAIYLSEKANKVYLVHRRDEFRADQMLVDRLYNEIANNHKIELVLSCKPYKLIGENKIDGITVLNLKNEEKIDLKVQGVFVAIGRGADTDIIDKNVQRNELGYIVSNSKMETNIQGVYVAGDIRNTELRQIVSATNDGAIATTSAFKYIKSKK